MNEWMNERINGWMNECYVGYGIGISFVGHQSKFK